LRFDWTLKLRNFKWKFDQWLKLESSWSRNKKHQTCGESNLTTSCERENHHLDHTTSIVSYFHWQCEPKVTF
jgi:hypothetical protein